MRTIAPDDPGAADVRALLETHLAQMRSISPPGSVHALDVDALRGAGIDFFSLREGGRVIAVGALKRLDGEHAEIKSMHTVSSARRSGAASRMLDHLLDLARERGIRRVSLETGRPDDFRPAQELYRRRGFVECPPFASYTEDEFSLCMTLLLDEDPPERS